MLRENAVEKCNSKYIKLLVIIHKESNGDLRVYFDERYINKHTTPQYKFPMYIEAIVGRITGPNIFTELDL